MQLTNGFSSKAKPQASNFMNSTEGPESIISNKIPNKPVPTKSNKNVSSGAFQN